MGIDDGPRRAEAPGRRTSTDPYAARRGVVKLGYSWGYEKTIPSAGCRLQRSSVGYNSNCHVAGRVMDQGDALPHRWMFNAKQVYTSAFNLLVTASPCT